MNLNETKKDLNPEIKKELEKSKLKVLTNENDFLVKNLKKAGWFIKVKIYKQQNFNISLLGEIMISWMKPKIFYLPNIKFLLNIQINTLNTKHKIQILVILFKSP